MTAKTATIAAIRMPLLALDRVLARLSMRGSDTDGRVTASIGSISAGRMGVAGSDRGSRGSGLRRGEAIAVPPLFSDASTTHETEISFMPQRATPNRSCVWAGKMCRFKGLRRACGFLQPTDYLGRAQMRLNDRQSGSRLRWGPRRSCARGRSAFRAPAASPGLTRSVHCGDGVAGLAEQFHQTAGSRKMHRPDGDKRIALGEDRLRVLSHCLVAGSDHRLLESRVAGVVLRAL